MYTLMHLLIMVIPPGLLQESRWKVGWTKDSGREQLPDAWNFTNRSSFIYSLLKYHFVYVNKALCQEKRDDIWIRSSQIYMPIKQFNPKKDIQNGRILRNACVVSNTSVFWYDNLVSMRISWGRSPSASIFAPPWIHPFANCI